METTRKCRQCKMNIVLETDDFLIHKDSYYHFNCFVEHLTSKKRGASSIEDAKRQAEELKNESKNKVKDIIAKNHLFTWLQRKYDIVTMPPFIFTKMEDIFKGNYKGMSRPIPPEDLLDMWERKWDELCRLYSWNLSKGKSLDDVGRLNYDIAVILGKTTSYYAWKDTQKQKDESVKEIITQKKFDYNAIVGNVKQQNDENYIIDDEEE
jgi:hypothetical protein